MCIFLKNRPNLPKIQGRFGPKTTKMDFYPRNWPKIGNLRHGHGFFGHNIALELENGIIVQCFGGRICIFIKNRPNLPKIQGRFGPKTTKMDFYPRNWPKIGNLRHGHGLFGHNIAFELENGIILQYFVGLMCIF
jgi:hypothetical protein